jgi:hypothetical protein
MSSELTRTDLIRFVLDQADEADLDALGEAARQRRTSLRAITAAAVKEGAPVKIRDIKPKYLNGLTGTVKAIETIRAKRCAVVTLDRDSTQQLAIASAKYASLINHDSYDLTGVPLSCCETAR